MYRTYVVIGFIGVLIGGYLLLRSVGGLLNQVKVPLPNPPVAGLYLPRGSQIISAEDQNPKKYIVRFKNQHGTKLVFATLKSQLTALGYTVDESLSVEDGALTMRPPAGRIYFRVMALAPDFQETMELRKKLGKSPAPDALEKLARKNLTFYLQFEPLAED